MEKGESFSSIGLAATGNSLMDAAEIRAAIDGAAAAVKVGLQKMLDNN